MFLNKGKYNTSYSALIKLHINANDVANIALRADVPIITMFEDCDIPSETSTNVLTKAAFSNYDGIAF